MTDGPAAETLFSWIHVADLHVGHEDGPRRWDQALVLEALRRDIAAFRDYGLPAPDAILVTGDVAFSGGADEYATARGWLRDVAGTVGLGPDRVFVVPGNHDVDRAADQDRDTRRLVQSLRNGTDSLDAAFHDSGDSRRLAVRLGNYLPFAEGYAPACLGARADGAGSLFWAHRFDAREGLRVRLLGLNTALLSADDADRGKLRLGNEQIERGLCNPAIEPGEMVIALSHHPLHGGWLADEKEAGAWIRNYAHVHLHGQVHEVKSEATRSGGGGEFVRVSAGGRAASYGYSFAAVVAAERGPVLRIWPRGWSEKNKRFLVAVHNTPDRQAFAEHALRVQMRPSADEPVVPRALLPSSALFEGPGGMPIIPVPRFLGRSAELDALRRALAEDAGAVCVVASGIGGIGKTTLVREFVAREAERLFPEGAAWIDATALPGELGRVAQRFGWNRERLPTVDEANQWLANALHGRAVLLVVDNADAAQATEIPVPGGRCRTLITSRAVALHEDLGKPALALPLGKWSDEVCRTYLRDVSERGDLPDDALDGLARFVGNLPLAVRLLAKLLMRGVRPERLLAQLEEEPLGTLDSVARGADRGVAATFLAAYRGLEEAERRVLLAMSACTRATRVEVVAKVAGVSESATERALVELREQRSLVEYAAKAERAWGLHDVVRMFVREQAGADEAAERHVKFAIMHLEAHEEPTAWKAVELEMHEVLEAIEWAVCAGRLPYAKELLNGASAFLLRRGSYAEVCRILTKVLSMHSPEDTDRATSLANLAYAETQLGRYAAAIEHFDDALRIYGTTPLVRGSVQVLSNLSGCYVGQGNVVLAMRYAERAIAGASEINDPELSAGALQSLGICYHNLGRYVEAIGAWRQAYDTFVERNDLENQARCAGLIGSSYYELGDYDLAIAHLELALAVSEKIGHGLGQISWLIKLVALYRYSGDGARAKGHLERALRTKEYMTLPDEHPIARELDRLISRTSDHHLSRAMNYGVTPFYISKASIENIRAAKVIEWTMPSKQGWHVVLGENGSGKSTLLRAIGLALVGREEATALRLGLGNWVRGDAAEGRAEVTVTRPVTTPMPLAGNGAAADVSLHLQFRVTRFALTDEAPGDREIWNKMKGSFTAAYGPFRRFTDGDLEYERLLSNQPRLARHISLFDSRVALTESLAWLHDLNYKRLDNKPEGKLLEPFKALANDPGPQGERTKSGKMAISRESYKGASQVSRPTPDGACRTLRLLMCQTLAHAHVSSALRQRARSSCLRSVRP